MQSASGVVVLDPPAVAAVEEGGHPLPHLVDSGWHVDRQQLAVAHKDAAGDDRRPHVRRARAVHEGGGEVVDGLGVRVRWAGRRPRWPLLRRSTQPPNPPEIMPITVAIPAPMATEMNPTRKETRAPPPIWCE